MNGNGTSKIIQAAQPGSPWATMQNAVMQLAAAQTRREKNLRVQRLFELIGAFQASFVENARQLGMAERCLVDVTGGEIMAFQFGGTLAPGTQVRVIDAEGTVAPFLDAMRGRFVKLPHHVGPMAIELELPDGTKKVITPGDPVAAQTLDRDEEE